MINELKYLYKELDNLYGEVLYGTTQDYVEKYLKNYKCKRRCKMFEVEQYVIYRNGPKVELGKIKSLKEDFAFVYYHSGETAAATRYEDIFPIVNAHVIEKTTLGGGQ